MLPVQVKNNANIESGVLGEGNDRRYMIGIVIIGKSLLPSFAVVTFGLPFDITRTHGSQFVVTGGQGLQ